MVLLAVLWKLGTFSIILGGGDVHKILVIHSCDETHRGYSRMNSAMEKVFAQKGIDVELRHFYLGIGENDSQKHSVMEHLYNTLVKRDYIADVVICEGDDAAEELFEGEMSAAAQHLLQKIPIVIGGLHSVNWENVRNRYDIVMMTDYLDYETNIKVAHDLSLCNIVNVEFLRKASTERRRNELIGDIGHPPFVNNIDGRIPSLKKYISNPDNRDSIVVMVSGQSAKDIDVRHSTLIIGHKHKDVAHAGTNNVMLFSAQKENFGNGKHVLAGYFAGYEAIGTDLASTVCELFDGSKGQDVKMRAHTKNFYMDYDVMQELGLEYEDYAKTYKIINAPFAVAHPLIYSFTIFGSGMLLAVLVFTLFIFIQRLRDYRMQTAYNRLQTLKGLSMAALNSADGRRIDSADELLALLMNVDKAYQSDADELRAMMYTVGVHSKVLRLPLLGSFSGKPKSDAPEDTHEWWRVNIRVSKSAKGNYSLVGLIVNVNTKKNHELKLQISESIAVEAQRKEDFLMNMSHEIRTPLNAIMGFCDIIAYSDGEMIDSDEREMMSKAIRENCIHLTKIVTDILLFSKIETGRMEYVYQQVDAKEVIRRIYDETRRSICVNHRLVLVEGRDLVAINVDPYRLQSAVSQYVSNAVKFSPAGSEIRLGWQYHLNRQMMEIYVDDDGKGIPAEKQDSMFSLFWKDDEFVPGIGIGLNIVKRLVTDMGGEVQVDSMPGVGSRFSIFLDATFVGEKTALEA